MENIKRVNLLTAILINMNRIFWLLACFFTLTISAQEKLVVMVTGPNMYVVYPANGTESLQNISNQFGLSVAKLSAYNNININTSVAFAKGTEIKIPFTKDNLLQQPNESSAPLYHMIRKGDNLYRLSQAYNKVPIASLREWNNMKNDVVKDGQLIMIGYMVNGKSSSTKKAEPKKDIPAINNTTVINPPAPDKKYLEKKEPVTPPVAKTEKQMPDSAAYKVVSKDNKTVENKKPVITDLSKNDSVTKTAKNIKPTTELSKNDSVSKIAKDIKPATELPKKDSVVKIIKDTKPAEEKRPIIEAKKKETAPAEYVPKEGDEGYFAAAYGEYTKGKALLFRTGDAATFKTVSGWRDRKYYVLMNDIAPKTIVRITSPTNKSVCAMVLGPLQETKGASGLLFRISNSAVSALGVSDTKFTVKITYFE